MLHFAPKVEDFIELRHMDMKRLSAEGKGVFFLPNLTIALNSINAKFFCHFDFRTLLPNLVGNIKFQKHGGNK